jgi:hypothetical protein
MYDVKKLQERLKARGLDLAEDAAAILVDEVFAWGAEEAAASETKVDDFLAALLPLVKPVILSDVVDLIDREDDRG